ncbi:amino acid ABC transporter permease [Frigidibacter sp. MR17.14]|uniref:amino acid ABC transporter permease n=1 Tax=Frigidibacter sp. MR17.14 TaxID=3126509 RepID=UPI003012A8F4
MTLAEIYNYRVALAYLPDFAWGLWSTLWISAVCLCLSLGFGALVAMGHASQSRWIRLGVVSYVELIRSTPLLIQVYFIYYGLAQIPVLNIPMPPLACGILALTIHSTAYMSEIIRGGIEAVDPGQVEGAKALGMSRRQAMIHIIYPQAIANVIPPILGQGAVLIKDTSVLSFIAVYELLSAGLTVLSDRVMPVEAFITPAIGYLLIYALMLTLSARAKRHFAGRRH